MFPLKALWVQFLVGELRSSVPCDTVQTKFWLKKKKKKTKLNYFEICGLPLKNGLRKFLRQMKWSHQERTTNKADIWLHTINSPLWGLQIISDEGNKKYNVIWRSRQWYLEVGKVRDVNESKVSTFHLMW